MGENMKFITVILPVLALMILAACNNSSSESGTSGELSQNNSNSPKTNNEAAKTDSAENAPANNTETNEKKEDSAVNNCIESQKDEYLKKLKDTKKEMDELLNNPEDDSSYALKKVEGDRYDAWDALLNEIYGVLQKQLSPDEMGS